jgi:hypothetical protein
MTGNNVAYEEAKEAKREKILLMLAQNGGTSPLETDGVYIRCAAGWSKGYCCSGRSGGRENLR